LGEAQGEQGIAPIVVNRRVLGKELYGPVEVLDRGPVVAKPAVRDAAVVQNGCAPVVWEVLIAKRFRIGFDRLFDVAAQEGGGGLLRFGSGIHAGGVGRRLEQYAERGEGQNNIPGSDCLEHVGSRRSFAGS